MFPPRPLAAAYTVLKIHPPTWSGGVRCLQGKLGLELLDGLSIEFLWLAGISPRRAL